MTLKLKCGKVVCIEFFIFLGSLLGHIQGDQEPVSLTLIVFSHRQHGLRSMIASDYVSCKKEKVDAVSDLLSSFTLTLDSYCLTVIYCPDPLLRVPMCVILYELGDSTMDIVLVSCISWGTPYIDIVCCSCMRLLSSLTVTCLS